MFKKMKENKKKGFTLVELIVVLVILAILAALLIPALTGYIDKARKKSIIAETRQVVMAAQTLADEAYAKKDVNATVTFGNDNSADVLISDVADLAEVDAKNIDEITTEAGGNIAKVTYKKNGKTCTYTKDDTTGSDAPYNVD